MIKKFPYILKYGGQTFLVSQREPGHYIFSTYNGVTGEHFDYFDNNYDNVIHGNYPKNNVDILPNQQNIVDCFLHHLKSNW